MGYGLIGALYLLDAPAKQAKTTDLYGCPLRHLNISVPDELDRNDTNRITLREIGFAQIQNGPPHQGQIPIGA